MVRTFAASMIAGAALFAGSAWAAETPSSLGQGPGSMNGPAAPQAPQRPQRVASPYWDDGAASDLPAADIRTVPGAAAAAVQARWEFNESLVDLSNAVRLMQLQQESKPEFVDAITNEKNAYEAMLSARKSALASLRDNAAYMAGEDLRRKVSQQIEDEAFQDKPDPARIEALAKLKLEYSRDNRKLEAAVLEGDQAYVSARQQYMDAGAKVRGIRQQQSMAVLTDSNLIMLRRSVSENRVNKLASAAYLRSAIRARNIALDYATFYRSYDRQPYYTADYWYGNYGRYGYRY